MTLTDDVLTIRGEKREEKEEKGKNIVSASATMARSIALVRRLMPIRSKRGSRKGVLKVTLPKKPEAQKKEKKIEVKTG